MDYDYTLNKVFVKAEYFIIKQFKTFKIDDRPFPHAADKIRFHLTKKYGDNLIGKNFNIFESCHRFFNFRKDYYGNTTSISKIVEVEIRKEFGEVIKINKPVDNNFKVIDNYTFNRFIYDLIIYDSLKRIEARLGENSDLYKLFYETDEYGSFTLEAFDGHIINSKIYQDLYSKVYPNKKIPVAIGSINQYGNKEWSIKFENDSITKTLDEFKKNDSATKNPEINTTIFNISKFTVDEKIFLWHVLYNAKTKFQYPEFAKILLLTDGINDLSIFHEKSGNNSLYRKINEGIQYYKPIKRRIFIDGLIKKLEYFNLKVLNAELILIKNKIP